MSYERDPRQQPGLGDRVHQGLLRTGIPQALGLENCGACQRRQAQLNAFGAWFDERLQRWVQTR